MNIDFVKYNKNEPYAQEVRRLYNTAFPADERAPFGLLARRAKKKNIDFFVCMDGSEWVGLLYVVNYLDMSYVFYFAVDEEKRGRGYGTAILHAAREKYSGRRLFLAIEEVDEKYENYGQRLSRLRFYENAGFIRSGQKMQEGQVIYDLMGIGGSISNREYRRLIKSFAGIILLFFTMEIIEDPTGRYLS